MKVVKKKTDNGHVLLDVTASTAEVSQALNQASEQFCVQMNIQPVRGKTPAEIEAFFKQLTEQVNAKLPTTHRISKVVIRTEDFKRTGSMKVSRKDN